MFHDDNDPKAHLSIDKKYVSRTAEIFNVILKQLGIGFNFYSTDDMIGSYDNDIIESHTLDGCTYMCTDYQFWLITKMHEIREEVLDKYPIITKNKLNAMILDVLNKGNRFDGAILKDLKELVAEETDQALDDVTDELLKESNADLDKDNKETTEEKPKKRSTKKKSLVK